MDSKALHRTVDSIFTEVIEPWALATGFEKRSKSFIRWKSADQLDRIFWHASMSRSAPIGLLEVFVSLGFKNLAKLLQPVRWLNISKELLRHPVAIAGNIGYLDDPPHYRIWELIDMESAPMVGHRIKTLLANQGREFFDRFSSLARLATFWQQPQKHYLHAPNEPCYLAAAHVLLGEGDLGVALLASKVAECEASLQAEDRLSIRQQRDEYREALTVIQAAAARCPSP